MMGRKNKITWYYDRDLYAMLAAVIMGVAFVCIALLLGPAHIRNTELQKYISTAPPWVVLSGLAAAPAVLLTWYWRHCQKRQDISHRSQELGQHEKDLGVRLRSLEIETNQAINRLSAEGFMKAAEMIGSLNIEVQLGGIYALERVLCESPKYKDTVADILCSFIRRHCQLPDNKCGTKESVEHFFQKEKGHDMRNGEASVNSISQEQTPILDGNRRFAINAALKVLGRNEMHAIENDNRISSLVDLSSCNLSRFDFSNLDFDGADFSGSTLTRAIFYNTKLAQANFWLANLTKACFRNADLSSANFLEADLTEALFAKTELRGTGMGDTNLSRARIDNCNLEDVRLADALLNGTILINTNLNEAIGITKEQLDSTITFSLNENGFTTELRQEMK